MNVKEAQKKLYRSLDGNLTEEQEECFYVTSKAVRALENIKETIFIERSPDQRLFRIGVRVDGGIVYTPYIELTRIGTGILTDKSRKLKSLMEVLEK